MLISGIHDSSLLNVSAGYQFNDATGKVQLVSIKRESVDVSDLISSVIEERLIKEIKKENTNKP